MKRELMNLGKLYLVLLLLASMFVLYKGQALWPPFALLSVTYLVLIPGYLLNHILYPGKMPFTERLACSLAFGFVLLATSVLYLSTIGLRITAFSATVMLLGIYALLGLGVKRVQVEHAEHADK